MPGPGGQPSEAGDNRSYIDETKYILLKILMKLWKPLPQRLSTQIIREKTQKQIWVILASWPLTVSHYFSFFFP